MISYVFGVFLDVFHYLTKIPIVKQVTKKSIMGHQLNKTMDYYFTRFETTPLDENYLITYKCDNKDYMLVTNKDNFSRAIEYIKTFYFTIETIITAAIKIEEDTVDITEKVKMFAGPRGDFYVNTPFHTRKEHISEYDIYILTSKFEKYVCELDGPI